MDPQTEELARAVAEIVGKGVDERLEHIKTGVDERLQQFKADIENRLQTHFEGVDGVVKRAAEGYGANLERIEHELIDLNRTIDTKFTDPDRIVRNHHKRITALEKH